MEFTRLDRIIDLVFETASEVLEEEPTQETPEQFTSLGTKQPKFIPVSFNQACAERIGKHLGIELLRQSKATFLSPDGNTALVCSVSKAHGEGEEGFWFAFHPHQRDTLDGVNNPLLAYGCGSPQSILLVPYAKFKTWLPGLNMTRLPDREYWHVHIYKEADKYTLQRKSGYDSIDLTSFLLTD